MWIVVLLDSAAPVVWGPFRNQADASQFASWVGRSIDPAGVFELIDPTEEMLAWDQAERERNNKGES